MDLLVSDRRIDADSYVIRASCGGAPLNVATGVARLGTTSALLGGIGNDRFGSTIRGLLARYGVVAVSDSADAVRSKTSIAVGWDVTSATPDWRFYRHADLHIEFGPRERAVVESAKILHVGTFALATDPLARTQWQAIDVAQKAGTMVTCDVNIRRDVWPSDDSLRKALIRLFEAVEVAKLSENELEFVVGTPSISGAKSLLNGTLKLVIVTLGGDGVLFVRHSDTGLVPGFPGPVVDLAGAGDGFMASLLHDACESVDVRAHFFESRRETLVQSLTRANAAGSVVVRSPGTLPPVFDNECIEAVIQAPVRDQATGVVLFDIDGTLLDSRDLGKQALVAAATAVTGRPISSEGITFDGYSDPQNALKLLQAIGMSGEDADLLLDPILTTYLDLLGDAVSLSPPTVLPGVTQLLEYLRNRHDLVLGLMTGNTEEAAAIKLRSVGLDGEFSLGVFGSDRLSRYDLPALARQRVEWAYHVDLPPNAFLIVGDTVHDVGAARQFGAWSIGVGTGGASLSDLTDAGGDVVLQDLVDPMPVLRVLRLLSDTTKRED